MVWVLHLPEEACPAEDHHPLTGTVCPQQQKEILFFLINFSFFFFFTKCAICATTFVSSFFSHADIPKSCVRFVGGQMDDVIKVKVYLMIVNHMWMDGWMDGMFH